MVAILFFSREASPHKTTPAESQQAIAQAMLGHIGDSHALHFGSVHIALPVILYRKGDGWYLFSSKHLYDGHHQPKVYKGFNMVSSGIEDVNEKRIYDFSITKNVVWMLFSIVLLVLCFMGLAYYIRKQGSKVWLGTTVLPMVLIRFIRNEVARKQLGEKDYERFTPYLLTIFFYIFLHNLLGLLPEGANITGNLSITGTLALVTLLFTIRHSSKAYWKHLFMPPGVPLAMRLVIVPIEIFSALLKPCILAIRLFANIFCGHLLLLALAAPVLFIATISLTYATFVAIPMVMLSVGMLCLKMLVSLIQAYVFTLLSASTLAAVRKAH